MAPDIEQELFTARAFPVSRMSTGMPGTLCWKQRSN